MSSLGNKRFMSDKEKAEWEKTLFGRYSMGLKRHHFLLFGLPFIATLLFGSIYLSEFTSLRYKKHDERVQMLDEEEALNIGKEKRKVDMRDEFYVRITYLLKNESTLK